MGGAGSGTRTRTTVRSLDFESSANANSAIPARLLLQVILPRCEKQCQFWAAGLWLTGSWRLRVSLRHNRPNTSTLLTVLRPSSARYVNRYEAPCGPIND